MTSIYIAMFHISLVTSVCNTVVRSEGKRDSFRTLVSFPFQLYEVL
jgi:hypothetical protein